MNIGHLDVFTRLRFFKAIGKGEIALDKWPYFSDDLVCEKLLN